MSELKTEECVYIMAVVVLLEICSFLERHTPRCSLLSFSKMAKLEELEEVDLSGNMLKTVPTTIMNCRRMHTLIAHSNAIEVFPEVMQLMEMKVSQVVIAHLCTSTLNMFL